MFCLKPRDDFVFDVDRIIQQLLRMGRSKGFQLSQRDLEQLCSRSKKIFKKQKMLLRLKAPVKICGDIHGQYEDLLRLFVTCGFPPQTNYLFLGDYVDRGKRSVETLALLLAFKIKYPDNFFMLRGNHECAKASAVYGFRAECKQQYNVGLWYGFTRCFDYLPVAATIEDKIFCVHGGISPLIESMEQLRNMKQPSTVSGYGLLTDLLWSDPSTKVDLWSQNRLREVSVCYGAGAVEKFLDKFNFSMICRAHEMVKEGYQFSADQKVVTIFSAPNYCGRFANKGAIMAVDKSLEISFEILEPVMKKKIERKKPAAPVSSD